jgi:hypothetical protein
VRVAHDAQDVPEGTNNGSGDEPLLAATGERLVLLRPHGQQPLEGRRHVVDVPVQEGAARAGRRRGGRVAAVDQTQLVPVVAAREEIEAAFDGAAERYRAQGLVAVRPTLVASEALSERLVSVDVRWDYLDEQGRSAQQNRYRYVLRLGGEAEPKIQVLIVTP